MSEAFGAYARYYDLLYRDKDYAAEARYVDGLIQRHAQGPRSILDLGCGTGAHAVEFARLGYSVYGIDASQEMLERAQARKARLPADLAARLQFSAGDVRSFRAGRRFDVVTALFHVMSYQVEDEDLARSFATAAAHLAPGGIFIFDCWYGPAVLADPPGRRDKTLEDAATRVLRVAEPSLDFGRNLTTVSYHVRVTDLGSGHTTEIQELHRMRHLFMPEIRHGLQQAGFTLEAQEEWLTGAPLSTATWSALFIARSAAPGKIP